MALGVKTKSGLETGDIIQANSSIVIYEISGQNVREYDNAIIGDRIGYATGQTTKVGNNSYIEFVLINRVLSNQTPDFSSEKFYILKNAPVSFKANPDYNYLATTTGTNTNIWGQILSGLSSVLGIFSSNKQVLPTNTGINGDTTLPESSITPSADTPQQSWIQKNALVVGSFAVIAVAGIIVVIVSKKK